jgi:hypothetical protein
LERFYECDSFLIREKYSRGKTDREVYDRAKLYTECTKHIFDNLKSNTDRFDAKGKLFTLNISGKINKSEVTYGTFFSHITAEIEHQSKKYFRIDSHWYLLEDDLLELMNNDAKEYYTKYRLEAEILNKWPNDTDEDYTFRKTSIK